ncbi:hypothetical protein L204_104313 [Cryptococcus depauperatus]
MGSSNVTNTPPAYQTLAGYSIHIVATCTFKQHFQRNSCYFPNQVFNWFFYGHPTYRMTVDKHVKTSGEWESLEDRGLLDSELKELSEESLNCLKRLVNHEPESVPDFGIVKQAAVLVLLFQPSHSDKLHVLLTTRARTLRRHPLQTALPGGKVDADDWDAIYTARREAWEEVNLPIQHPSIHFLTTLEPVMTILPLAAHIKNHIIVIPVVCFLSDLTLLTQLHPNPDEVDAIFTHPLKGCHTGTLEGKDTQGLVERGGEWWPHEEEFHSIEDRIGTTGGYRMHVSLTADILIHAASVAYGSPPSFSHFAPNQPPFSSAISNVVLELPDVIDKSTSASMLEDSHQTVEWGGTEIRQAYLNRE